MTQLAIQTIVFVFGLRSSSLYGDQKIVADLDRDLFYALKEAVCHSERDSLEAF